MGKNVWDSLGGWYTYVFRLGGGVACVGDIFASRCLAVLRKPAQNELQQVVSLSIPLRFPQTPYFSASNYKGEHVPCDQNGFWVCLSLDTCGGSRESARFGSTKKKQAEIYLRSTLTYSPSKVPTCCSSNLLVGMKWLAALIKALRLLARPELVRPVSSVSQSHALLSTFVASARCRVAPIGYCLCIV